MSRTSTSLLLALAVLVTGGACSRADSGAGKAGEQRERGSDAAAGVAGDACGRVAYVRAGEGHGHGHQELRLIDAQGGPSQALALDPERSHFPAALAPDGRTLLVLSSTTLPSGKTSDRFGLLELGEDGAPVNELRPIGPEGAALRNPSFSPDGSWIAFESDAESFRDLYRLELASDRILRLTDNPEGNFEPAISPDGRSIAFVSSRDQDAELYRINADGGEPRRLSESPGDDMAPRWTGGERLAFVSARDRQRGLDLYLLELQSGVVTLLRTPREGAAPVLVRDHVVSPAGDAIAFTELGEERGKASIVVVDIESGRELMRSAGPGVDEQPSWSPGGEMLVFSRGQRDQAALVRIGRDGGGLVLLTGRDEREIAWLPRWIPAAACRPASPVGEVRAGQG